MGVLFSCLKNTHLYNSARCRWIASLPAAAEFGAVVPEHERLLPARDPLSLAVS